jgi:CBS-domain-containing membrane protein
MKTVDKPLLSLTAADLMSPMVLIIPENMSLQGAAHMLAQAHISGAPVVNQDGQCVGEISAHDFIALVDKGTRAAKQPAKKECFCSAWQIEAHEQLPEDVVRNYMTADPVTVLPDTRMGPLAQIMVDAHIHRVIVLDRTGRPIGVVSCIDVLAAVARAARANGSAVEQESSHEDHEEYCRPTAEIAVSDRR